MDNEKIFEFMEKMYADLKGDINGINVEIKEVKTEISGIKGEINEIKTDINVIKGDIRKIDFKLEELNKKVDLSLEGHKTNTEQLNRIETEVSRHEEIILRRVK